MGVVDEGVNNETQILLRYRDFHRKNVDEAWNLLDWVAWDSFEFEKASCVCGCYFPDPCAFYARSYYAPLWCDICNSTIILHHVIMHVMLNLTLHQPGTILMLS